MTKYIDVVSEKLFENNKSEDVEEVFKLLSINKVYVVKEINKKEDLEKPFVLPTSKEVVYKKAFLVNNLNLNISKKELVVGNGGDVTNISKVLLSKNLNHLFNPFSEKLVFDEGSVNLAKEKHKKIIININYYKKEKATSSKIIKQTPFILKTCMKKQVDFVFCSYAKNIKELVDPAITINFLKIFKVPETLSKRLLQEDL